MLKYKQVVNVLENDSAEIIYIPHCWEVDEVTVLVWLVYIYYLNGIFLIMARNSPINEFFGTKENWRSWDQELGSPPGMGQ